MKANIHPQWYHDAVVTCTCGNTFQTGSTKQSLQIDICSACHPFFTGEMKFVDRQGRVDKFQQKMAKAQQRQAGKKPTAKADGSANQADPKSYQEILLEQQRTLKAMAKQRAA